MIIGLTGSYGAGKDTAADFLRSKGFSYHSLSDLVREELKKLNLPITRENLIVKANEIRKRFGPGELARRAMEVAQNNQEKNILIVSIRNPSEVTELRKFKDFRLWFIDAPPRIRYDRTVKRARTDDFSSYQEFLEKEGRENSSDPNAQQLIKVAEMADAKIINDADIPSFFKKIEDLIKI